MSETTNVKAWVENLTSLRSKMQARKDALLAEVAEIDGALAQFSPPVPSGKTAKGHAPKSNGHATPAKATYRALVIAAVAEAEHGLDADGLCKAVGRQRRGADRNIVLTTARNLVQLGQLRAEGKQRAYTYYPITPVAS